MRQTKHPKPIASTACRRSGVVYTAVQRIGHDSRQPGFSRAGPVVARTTRCEFRL